MASSKAFAFMAGALVVLAIPAIVVSTKDRSGWESDDDPLDGELVLPEFEDLEPGRLRTIELVDRDGSVRLEQRAEAWVLANADGYPADAAAVIELVRSLQTLRVDETSTSNPAKHARIGLVAPEDGGEDAVLVRVLDGSDEAIAELLVGNVDRTRSSSAVFVRRPGQDQCYLANGEVPRQTSTTSWFETRVLSIPTSEVRSAEITFADDADADAGYTLTREDPESFGFVLAPVDEGREPGAEWKWSALARNATSLTASDVRSARSFDASGAERATIAVETYDGLAIEAELVRLPSEVEGTPGPTWIRFEVRVDEAAAGASDQPGDDAAEEADRAAVRTRAAELTDALDGWWFQVPAGTATSLWTPRAELYAPLPEPAPGEAAGPTLPAPITDEGADGAVDDGSGDATSGDENAESGEPAGSAGQEG